MLPAGARLRRRDEFVTTLRAGRARRGRAGRAPAVLVAHLHAGQAAGSSVGSATASTATARAGFVVSRSVGGAVVRNRVRRRLRHLVAARLGTLPPGSQLVVRALPGSATATSNQLAAALDDALSVHALSVHALSAPAPSATDRGTARP